MINRIGKLWRDDLGAMSRKERLYLDFRQLEYPHVSGTPTYETVDADIVAEWRLGEGTGTAAGDSGRNRWHLTGVATPTWGTGPTELGGYAAVFASASSQYYRHATAGIDTWAGNSARTFAVRFKTSTAADMSMISQRLDSGTNRGYELRLAASQDLYFAIDAGATSMIVHYAGTLCDGAWHKVVVRYDGGLLAAGVRVRIDGADVSLVTDTDTLAATCYEATALLSVGSMNGVSRYFDGSLSHPQVWSRELTDDECEAWEADGTFNRPGSHILTGGVLQYLVPMQTKFTLRVMARLKDTAAADRPLIKWAVDSTHQLNLYMESAQPAYRVLYQDGGTQRNLISTTFATANEWRLIDAAIDLSAASQTASGIYEARALTDGDWGGAPDAVVTKQPIFTIDATSHDIAYVELIQGYAATAADVANDYRDVLDERIFWSFNGHATGMTRCNVTWAARSFSLDKRITDKTSEPAANTLTMELLSTGGEFAGDQVVTWAPSTKDYAGSATERFLEQCCRVEYESWYGNDWETVFSGRLDRPMTRSTDASGFQVARFTASDLMQELNGVVQNGVTYDSLDLCDTATETDSILHMEVRLGLQRSITNYASNSSFENATIGNSWTAAGGGAIARAAQPLLGTYGCELTNDADGSNFGQIVTFTGLAKLNVGDKFSFSCYVKSATTQNAFVTIQEQDSGGTNVETNGTTTSITGGAGWHRLTVSHTVSDSTSDRIRVACSAAGNALVSYWDVAVLTRGRETFGLNLNNNDGASGTESADDADVTTYDRVGFDVDAIAIDHPWVFLPQFANLLNEIRDYAVSAGTQYIGIDSAGTWKMRSILKTSYVDPASSRTITTFADTQPELDTERFNHVIVAGRRIIDHSNLTVVLWDLARMEELGADGLPSVTVTNGSVWPGDYIEAGQTGQEFWCEYQWEGLGMYSLSSKSIPREIYSAGAEAQRAFILEKITMLRQEEFIGARAHDLSLTTKSGTAMTTTVFDYTTKPDAARLVITNGTGSSQIVRRCFITGTPITRRGTWIHDAFVDADDIRQYGYRPLVISNQYLATKTQVETIADYRRKRDMAARWTYPQTQHGPLYYYEPADWCTLLVSGTEETQAATVEVKRVLIEGDFSKRSTTKLWLREVVKNFTHDANAKARLQA